MINEMFDAKWMGAEKLHTVQVDLRKKDFLARLDWFKEGVIFTVRVEKDSLELLMDEEGWEYLFSKIKKLNKSRMRSKWEKKETQKNEGDANVEITRLD
jgi:hypothetical protein